MLKISNWPSLRPLAQRMSRSPSLRTAKQPYFCERQQRIIFEWKVWSKCKNGEGEWWETLQACEVRALHTRGSCLQRFLPSENVWKRMFCSLPITRSLHLPHIPVGVFTDRSIFSLNLTQIQIPTGTKWPIAITSTEQCQHVNMSKWCWHNHMGPNCLIVKTNWPISWEKYLKIDWSVKMLLHLLIMGVAGS